MKTSVELEPGSRAEAVDTPDAPFRGCFTVDLSPVLGLIDEVKRGDTCRADWVELLMHGARIFDLDECAAQLVGSPAGRPGMIGQPLAFFAPPDSWPIITRLIIEVTGDLPGDPPRSSAVESFILRAASLKLWRPAAAPDDHIRLAVEGTLSDDRSPWALRASEQRYRRLIHYLPTALLQVDARELAALFQDLRLAGFSDLSNCGSEAEAKLKAARNMIRVTDANLGAVRLFGANGAEALLGPVDFLFAASPEAQGRVIAARFKGQRSYAEQIRIRRFDGELRDVQLSVTYPTPPEQLDVTLISLEDVTDRLRTEAQLRQVQEDYSRAARITLLGELASSIAHEVNQPLSAIAMNAQTSLRWLSRDNPNVKKVKQLTLRIAESAQHASEIVQRVRGMVGSHAPERRLLDLNNVVMQALLFVQHDLEANSISLALDRGDSIPTILGDPVQLQQVLVNLLLNSIQAIVQSRRPAGHIHIQTQHEDDDCDVSLSISDNGPGIPPENLERVFESFFTTKQDGMGIGLAVCHSIIAAHGGTIAVQNAPGSGAVFSFSVPAATLTDHSAD